MKRPLVEIRHAAVTLEGTLVIRDIAWQLRPGEHWAVLGPNDAGKSTFLRLVRGDIWPDQSGEGRSVLILDEPCSGLNPAAREGVLRMIETIGRGRTGLVLVTHHLEDLVPSITHLMLTDGGRIVAQGEKAAMLKDRRLQELLGP